MKIEKIYQEEYERIRSMRIKKVLLEAEIAEQNLKVERVDAENTNIQIGSSDYYIVINWREARIYLAEWDEFYNEPVEIDIDNLTLNNAAWIWDHLSVED